MATQTKTTGQKKEFKLEQVLVLWKHKSKKTGNEFFSGYYVKNEGQEQEELVGFYNTDKKNPKEPDLRIYKSDDTKKEFISLWVNASANGRQYLTGKFKGKRIVGFINKGGNKAPYISVYYSDQNEQKQEEPEQVTFTSKDDKPF